MKKKILIIEDDDDVRSILAARLQRCGFEVITAKDGKLAVERAKKESPDLIVLDLRLPKLPGEEVCRQIRREGSSVPIIMATGKTSEADRIIGKVIGANHYITKPFEPQDLLKKIYKLLNIKQP